MVTLSDSTLARRRHFGRHARRYSMIDELPNHFSSENITGRGCFNQHHARIEFYHPLISLMAHPLGLSRRLISSAHLVAASRRRISSSYLVASSHHLISSLHFTGGSSHRLILLMGHLKGSSRCRCIHPAVDQHRHSFVSISVQPTEGSSYRRFVVSLRIRSANNSMYSTHSHTSVSLSARLFRS